MYFLSELSKSTRLKNCVANLNPVLAKLARCVKKKWRKIEGSLAEADLMACSLLIIFVITRESHGIISRRTLLLLLQEIAHKHAFLNLVHLMCFYFHYESKYPKLSAARFTEFTAPVLFDTSAATCSPHNCTLYLLGQMDMLILPVGFCHSVCVHAQVT